RSWRQDARQSAKERISRLCRVNRINTHFSGLVGESLEWQSRLSGCRRKQIQGTEAHARGFLGHLELVLDRMNKDLAVVRLEIDGTVDTSWGAVFVGQLTNR